jgi:hypothetical protein
MRPNKQQTDLEFWSNAIQYWKEKIEQYFLLDDREGETRCEAHLFRAELAHQEAKGEIIVYSGRQKPRWAK